MRSFLALLLLPATITFADSYESQALRALVNNPEFAKYVAQNEAQRNVTFIGVRATNKVNPPEKIFWRIDFEGQQSGRRLICMGSAQSDEQTVLVNFDLPIDCRVEL